MLFFFALGNAKVLSFALGDAKVPNANGFASQWNIGLKELYQRKVFPGGFTRNLYPPQCHHHLPWSPPPPFFQGADGSN